jgi:tRNA U34 5-methylaminomethyl-2-thiouridine-forming methyltransferase MnmC
MALIPLITKDGSSTLFVTELNEHYHSINGAVQESMYIFIGKGYFQLKASPAIIFEAGFGTGLNAFLTFLESEKEGREIHYTAIEKYPLEDDFVQLLNYPEKTDPSKAAVFKAIHKAPWEQDVKLSEHFTLHKMKGDLRIVQLKEANYDLVYFDAFGPAVQPDLWTEEIFRMLFQSMKAGSCLVTYSVRGSVKRALKAAGFCTEKLPGPPGKREITRATKLKENGK